jgi:hypothetical protein
MSCHFEPQRRDLSPDHASIGTIDGRAGHPDGVQKQRWDDDCYKQGHPHGVGDRGPCSHPSDQRTVRHGLFLCKSRRRQFPMT